MSRARVWRCASSCFPVRPYSSVRALRWAVYNDALPYSPPERSVIGLAAQHLFLSDLSFATPPGFDHMAMQELLYDPIDRSSDLYASTSILRADLRQLSEAQGVDVQSHTSLAQS
jgi:hypothetical protein